MDDSSLPLGPKGYKFRPTEDELVRFFLRPKVMGLPLPTPNYILELNLYGENEPSEIWDTFMGPCPARIDVVAGFTEFTQKILSANLDILDDPVLQSHRVDNDPLLSPAKSSSVSIVVGFSNSRQQGRLDH
jgi:hypothetical protein